MEFLSKTLDNYVVDHSEDEPQLLKKLSKETWQKILNPRMLSGAYQGRVLALLSKLINPKLILEIGTYTGYSALCLAEGLQKGGALYTIDKNEELYDFSRKYFDASEYKSQIKAIVGNALNCIIELPDQIDLVFIDADKSNYMKYYDLVVPKMKSGGVILSDNVLWSGKVIEKINEKDEDTKALVAYNSYLKNDPRVETVLLPIREGLTISRVL